MSDLPRVIYLAHRVPYPPDKGDRIRNFHVLREVSKHARVWLACLADEPVGETTKSKLSELCERVEILPVAGKMRWLRAGLSALMGKSLTEGAFHEPSLVKLLESWGAKTPFAAALVSASSLAPYLERLGDIPKFVDLVDVDSQKWFDFAESKPWPKSWLYRFEGRRVRKLEIRLSRWAKAVTIVSRAECDVYDRFAVPAKGTVATNGVDLEYFRPSARSANEGSKSPSLLARRASEGSQLPIPSDEFSASEKLSPIPGLREPSLARRANGQSLAFVGALDYLPNIDAAVWFAHDIWPKILARYTNTEFHIIGRRPTAEVQRLAELPGVKLFADVPDIRPYLADAAMAVCPIRIARGLQNKVIEAMAMGKATIAAPAAIAALGVRIGDDLLSATTPDEWVEAVSNMLNDGHRRQRLGAAARDYVERYHHWDRCLQPLIQAMTPHLQPAEAVR